MKKLLSTLLILFSCSAYAQTPVRAFGAGLELGVPANSVFAIGFGGSGKAEVPLVSALSLSVTGGFTSFHYKSALIGSSTTQPAVNYIPVKAGVKYYFSPGFYAEGEAGNAFQTNYTKENLFIIAVGPGFIVSTGEHSGIDFGFRYENWGSGRLRQTAIRVAYRFGW
ncbi:outer membrane beta-barrel protein [Mucilaginibacter sp. AK015]|uniref:outer membrane beta-barrel protein n=1 Tax=Mucilaginibacter sp. AK015 TaxID=2723072 RepID=UPI00160C8BC8|nr:outer membrane beta-barrel protein [Mucilaginibacter sp. AK015]MBB5397567.1 hypothetical protein [Mucilaginibacter sp. AK015]